MIDCRDLRGFDPNKSEHDTNVASLCQKLNADEDPCKHIHIVWYVISSPRWTEADEHYCSHVFRRADDSKIPVIIIINKVGVCTWCL